MKTGEIGVDVNNKCPGCSSNRWRATNPVWIMVCSECGKYELSKYDDIIKEINKEKRYETKN